MIVRPLLQARECEREHGREAVQSQIEDWKRMQRAGGPNEEQGQEQARKAPPRSRAGRDWDGKDRQDLRRNEARAVRTATSGRNRGYEP